MITIILLILIIIAAVSAYRSAEEDKFFLAFIIGVYTIAISCFIILIGTEIASTETPEIKTVTYPIIANYEDCQDYYKVPTSAGVLTIPRNKIYFSTGDNTVDLHYTTIKFSKTAQLLWAPFAKNHDIIDYYVINQRR